MSAFCPVCNGFTVLTVVCHKCNEILMDGGRVMDYYDDYSAYMPIDQLKLEDGYPDDLKNNNCPHYVTCPNCYTVKVHFVKE